MPDATACDWPGCSRAATHRVKVRHKAGGTEVYRLCREHEDACKTKVRGRIGSKPVDPGPGIGVSSVKCGECGYVLDEAPGLPGNERKACPRCGGMKRDITVMANDHVELHDRLGATLTRAGRPKRKWSLKLTSGDSYTRDHDGWGQYHRWVDRERGCYREIIEFWDGTILESSARLRDHHELKRRRPS